MCKLLEVSRSNYYTYKESIEKKDSETKRVIRIFEDSRSTYGTRRIKAACLSEGVIISRRRIARIMKAENLASVYTIANYKPDKSKTTQSEVENIINRQFDDRNPFEAVVGDLTYVRIGNRWGYVCTLIDLHNREIIGYSCGFNKDQYLVLQAFANIKSSIMNIDFFHSDRGKEFINKTIDSLLENFGIERSLSNPGSPYDNAVAEAGFKTLKIEFIYQHVFRTLEHLRIELGAYVWWFNNERLHSSLEYLSPINYANSMTL